MWFDTGIVQTIGDGLRRRGWQISVAESLTGGQVQTLLTSISGASDFFAGGLTAYHVSQKVRILGVDERAARACNGVSAEMALLMACGANHLFHAQIAIATTGYAEPAPSWHVATPFAFCAVVCGGDRGTALVERVEVAGQPRQQTQRAVAEFAIGLLARFLETRGEATCVTTE